MMRSLLGLLVVLNVLVFLYGHFVLDRQGEPMPARLHQPDVGSIRLLSARVLEGSGKEAETDRGTEEERSTPPVEKAVEPPPPGEVPASAVAEAEAQTPESEPSVPPAMEKKEGAVSEQEQGTSEAVVPPESSAPAPPEMAGSPEQAPPAESPAPAEPAAEEPAVAPALACGEMGPFRSRVQARRVQRRLGRDVQTRLYKRPTPVTTAYWVYLPPLESRQAAKQAVKRLQEAGVKDLWLMPGGEYRNGVSLGLFSREEAARAHAERLRAKGFSVEILPKKKEKERYWLEFGPVPEEVLQQTARALPEGAAVEKKACGQASAGN